MARVGRLFSVVGLVATASCSDMDEVSMIQAGAKVGDPIQELAMTNWLGHFYRIIRTKQNPVLASCCKMAKEKKVQPFLSWGKTNKQQQNWWNQVDCNTAVGALNPDEPVGTPNCETMTMFNTLLPEGVAKKPIELYSLQESSCSEEDRAEINATYLGEEPEAAMPYECAPSKVVESVGIHWDVFARCVRRILGVSTDCSMCYADFMSALGDVNPSKKGCIKECYGLEACSSLRNCQKQSAWCAECVQPELNKYYKCMGGPVVNQLNLEDIMRKLVHVWGSLH